MALPYQLLWQKLRAVRSTVAGVLFNICTQPIIIIKIKHGMRGQYSMVCMPSLVFTFQIGFKCCTLIAKEAKSVNGKCFCEIDNLNLSGSTKPAMDGYLSGPVIAECLQKTLENLSFRLSTSCSIYCSWDK